MTPEIQPTTFWKGQRYKIRSLQYKLMSPFLTTISGMERELRVTNPSTRDVPLSQKIGTISDLRFHIGQEASRHRPTEIYINV